MTTEASDTTESRSTEDAERVPNVLDFVDKAELARLTRRSDARGLFAVLSTWGIIGGALALLARYPHPLVFVLVVVVIGGRQLALAILQHEAAHRTLFVSRFGNDVFADLVCARPIGVDVARYRKHHLRHHAHTSLAADPDASLTAPFPTTPASLARKLLRDLSGIAGLKRLLGLFLMDLEVLEYTVAADVRRKPRAGRGTSDYLRAFLKNAWGALLTNAVILGVCALVGHAWVYSAWIVAMLTTFGAFMRIRSLSEHACLEHGPNPLKNTRTTRAGLLARATVAPVRVSFHLEHHLAASVPFFRLPELHRLLRERGAVGEPPGYVDVLRLVTASPVAPRDGRSGA